MAQGRDRKPDTGTTWNSVPLRQMGPAPGSPQRSPQEGGADQKSGKSISYGPRCAGALHIPSAYTGGGLLSAPLIKESLRFSFPSRRRWAERFHSAGSNETGRKLSPCLPPSITRNGSATPLPNTRGRRCGAPARPSTDGQRLPSAGEPDGGSQRGSRLRVKGHSTQRAARR
ncbi:hypothetical protein AAFF_G00073770 [Aldrovandia affinis]|uniref:Uncharacterized protein n=1 Tax=Aldrovandia affinis TaxID=143900 RepID=A0AAD7RY45_9TELE|nr:hypothetical protein AAFF_G00073770 [Aldrovandia affinis]